MTAPAVPSSIQKEYTVNPEKDIAIRNNGIHYSLPQQAHSSILLYDIRGRIAKTLINCMQPAGDYRIQIPQNMAQGRYILSLRAGEQKIDKAVLIAR
jgi:hypothetical protein